MRPSKRLLFSLPVLLSLGCGLVGKSGDGSLVSRLMLLGAGAATRITPQGGGVVREPSMSLTVPQGAVSEEVAITHTRIAVPEQKESVLPVQAAYKFGPAKLQFNKPASLRICYDVQDILARGLEEKTLQIQYVNPVTGEYVSMGGDVDLAQHCVSAPIYHFSAYVLTAQLLAIGDNAPTIGGASFFPGTPIAGLPATVRSAITDWDAGSAVATVRFFYRTAGSGALFKSLAMLPETNDGAAGQFYAAKIPAADITAAGLEYYIEAYDSLNKSRTRPATAPATFDTIAGDVRDASNAIRFQTTVTQMTAGFSRDLTVQVKGNSAPTYFPVPADTLTFAGDKGITSRPTWLSARYTAQIIGSSFLQADYGNETVSMPVSVYSGMMQRIELLHNDAVLPDPLEVDGVSVTQLDAAGYDAFDNFIFVQPVFGTTGGIGTFGDAANYGKFYAANVWPDTSGTITATVGGYSVSYNVLVRSIAVYCQYDVGTFDSTCIFN